VTVLPLAHPRWAQDGRLVGQVLHIDHFGNLITSIRGEDLPSPPATIEVGGHSIVGLSRTYAEGTDLLALIGSHGHLEISRKEGDAGAFLGAEVGDEVRII
jgi:S-adenosylmethionine hydrolase